MWAESSFWRLAEVIGCSDGIPAVSGETCKWLDKVCFLAPVGKGTACIKAGAVYTILSCFGQAMQLVMISHPFLASSSGLTVCFVCPIPGWDLWMMSIIWRSVVGGTVFRLHRTRPWTTVSSFCSLKKGSKVCSAYNSEKFEDLIISATFASVTSCKVLFWRFASVLEWHLLFFYAFDIAELCCQKGDPVNCANMLYCEESGLTVNYPSQSMQHLYFMHLLLFSACSTFSSQFFFHRQHDITNLDSLPHSFEICPFPPLPVRRGMKRRFLWADCVCSVQFDSLLLPDVVRLICFWYNFKVV